MSATSLAVISSGIFTIAMGAETLNVTVREKSLAISAIKLLNSLFINVSFLVKLQEKILRNLIV
jgi:hypothetical protein